MALEVVEGHQLAKVNFEVPIGAVLGFKLGMQNHLKLSLIEHFKDLPDPRVNRTKDHDLIDLLVIAVCTLLCAGESFNDMEDFGHAKRDWFKTFLTLRNGISNHDTFNRLFAALGPKAFLDCFLRWTARPCAGRSTPIRASNMS